MPDRHALLIGINRYPKIRGAELAGCHNDVELMRSLLERRFSFPPRNLEILLDEQATQAGIRAAFARLIARVSRDDIAYVHYSGHGSRLRDPSRPDRVIESLVPHDSGRSPLGPNRDILDRELDAWVRQLDDAGARVVLVFDCCHSGSVTRDVAMGMAAARARQIPPDYRDPGTSYEGARTGAEDTTRDIIFEARKRLSGWLSESREALLIAACRAEEKACEHAATVGDAIVRHGALTYFLAQALARARPDASWGSVFETIAPKITAAHPLQHPLLEGRPWTALFPDASSRSSAEDGQGRSEVARREHADDWGLLARAVTRIDGDEVTIAGGAAHGLVVGSLWDVYAPFVVRPGAGDEPIALVQLTRVGACAATGVIRERPGGAAVEPGARMLERATPPRHPPLAIHIDLPEGSSRDALARELSSSPALRVIDPYTDPADLRVRLVPARSVAVDGDPCPLLGTVRQSSWAVVGPDGRLAARLIPVGGDAPSVLLGALESVARFRRFMALESPQAGGALDRRVRLELRRGAPDERGRTRFVAARPEPRLGAIVFEEGDLADFVIHNDGDVDVFISLLEFGADLSTRLMLPYLDVAPYTTQSRLLRAGESLSVARYFECPEGLPLHLPDGFPWAAEPGSEADTGQMTFKLLVTRARTDFSSVVQGATRSGMSMHPLEAELAALASATRSFIPRTRARGRDHDWAVITRTVVVQRPARDVRLDPEGAPVIVVPGVALSSPGLVGSLRGARGEPARTRDLEPEDPQARALEDALTLTGARAVATIELHEARAEPTRALAPPREQLGEPCVSLLVEGPEPGWAQVVLSRDADGFTRWILPTPPDDAPARDGDETRALAEPQRFEIPLSPAGADGTRSLLGAIGKHVLTLLAVKLTERAAKWGASAVGRWEERVRPYCVRSFTARDYRELSPRTHAVVTGARATRARELSAAQWRQLACGRALMLVHGTQSSAAESFAELDGATVDALHRLYEGRVCALEHPTLSRDPEHNATWFFEQIEARVPGDARLELDLLGYSRGGVVCRTLAAWAPTRARGRVRVRRVISVGAPHRGTPLAEPDNLGLFLSVWTNALNLVPIPIGPDVLAGVLELAKEATVGTAKHLPGLQAMAPRSPLLTRLRAVEETRPAPLTHFAVSSRYGPGRATDESRLRRRLRRLAGETLARFVFKEPCDLVVPTGGVYEDTDHPHFPIPIDRRLVLGEDDRDGVDHTAYFAVPAVREQLLRWLA